MIHFKDYLRDLHQADKIDQDFDDWVNDLELKADTLGIFFQEYLAKIEDPRKL